MKKREGKVYGELKEKFLQTIKENTRVSYERIFKVTDNFEELLKKDINQFNLNEMEKILYSFKSNKRNTIESYGRIISSYLNWSVENGYSKINILKDFKPEDFEKYIANDEEYLTESKIRRYEDRCANFQDAVILRLLFIGACGRQMSEIRNLKEEDINFQTGEVMLTNTLKEEDGLPTKFTKRAIMVDERTLYLLAGAISQKTYKKKNGEMEERSNIRPETDLAKNEYVLRPSLTKVENPFHPVDKYVIFRRMAMLSEVFGVKLTTKSIQRSGMIHFAKSLVGDSDVVALEDIKIVADKFNVKSYHNLKGFITIENVKGKQR